MFTDRWKKVIKVLFVSNLLPDFVQNYTLLYIFMDILWIRIREISPAEVSFVVHQPSWQGLSISAKTIQGYIHTMTSLFRFLRKSTKHDTLCLQT